MTDDELRVLVRDAIARHLGGGQTVRVAPGSADAQHARPDPAWRAHASFGKFLNLPGDAEPGPCVIEPGVACNHCGFCKSYGH
jgi:hypothetical protein